MKQWIQVELKQGGLFTVAWTDIAVKIGSKVTIKKPKMSGVWEGPQIWYRGSPQRTDWKVGGLS